MTEEEVREIAERYVSNSSLGACKIVAIRRFRREDIPNPSTVGDEWIVQLMFESDDNCSTNHSLMEIDDATKIPRLLDSL